MSQYKGLKFWGSAILILFAAVLIIVKLSGGSGGGEMLLQDTISESDWTRGNPEAKVTLIEYSDFQCPACAYFGPIINDLMAEFDDHVYFAYRHFPLNIHDNAAPAARAAEAAGLQDKFWEMSDQLFVNQAIWSKADDPKEYFDQYAEEIGLDIEQFSDDYDSSAVKNAVENDRKSGDAIGINSTPSFFLNGVKLNNNPRDLESFRQIIRSALDENA